MKPERIQFCYDELDGWILLTEWNPITREYEVTGIWTAFELADHLEACEHVAVIGAIADTWCSTPNIEVLGNIVFVTCGTSKDGLIEEDFDFAKAIDDELGTAQRQKSLLGW